MHVTEHLTDTDLIRYLDREGGQEQRRHWRGHLAECHDCAGRFGDMERDSRTVTEWLERAAFEAPTDSARSESFPDGRLPGGRLRTDPAVRTNPPARTGRSAGRGMTAIPWLRAAIIVLLLTAPLAAIPPVREWVVTRVGLLGSAPPAPEPMAADAGATIRFAPAPGLFTVRVAPQADGTSLDLGRATGQDAVLESIGGVTDAGAAPVVSAELLRLPTSDSAMQYRLRLPASTTGVHVLLDGEVIEVSGAELAAGVSLDF